MERRLIYEIEAGQETLRLEQILKRHGFSRPCLIHIKKKKERLRLSGKPAFLYEKGKVGDHIEVLLEEEASSEKIVPAELPLTIVYEDEDLIVINKPAGMPVHPSMKNYENTMANALAAYYAKQGEQFVFRCNNRLDRDTSGLTVAAKNMLSGAILSAMAKNKEIRREYRAVVRGHVQPQAGTIDAPLSRKPGSIIERTVDFSCGEKAVTHYRVLEEKNGYSLVGLVLETGRTHQIRIHMKYLGYPLIGDYLYNPDMERIGRQALHAYRLSFAHPITGQPLSFTAPIPEDMQRVFEPEPDDCGDFAGARKK